MGIIYFIVAIIATTVGALAGLGGGVIIKPTLDLLGHYDITTISLLSSFTVFSMAIVSTYKQLKKGFVIQKSLVYLAIGAILGGIIGKNLFEILINNMPENQASGLQAMILAFLLIVVLFKKFLPDYDIKWPIAIFLVGLILGTTASFLGVGGGPINVMIIMMFLKMDIKEAAVASVFVILLSQLAKLVTFGVTTDFSAYDLTMLVYMIPAAILGGLIGFKLSHWLKELHIHYIFNILVFVLILLNVYNAYTFLA